MLVPQLAILYMKYNWYQNQLDKEDSKPDPRGKTFYNSFAEYAVDFPEAIKYYDRLNITLIKLESKWGASCCGIAGDYIYAFIGKFLGGNYFMRVCGNDDGSLLLEGEKCYLEKVLNDIKLLAPLNFNHLVEIFGFQYD